MRTSIGRVIRFPAAEHNTPVSAQGPSALSIWICASLDQPGCTRTFHSVCRPFAGCVAITFAPMVLSACGGSSCTGSENRIPNVKELLQCAGGTPTGLASRMASAPNESPVVNAQAMTTAHASVIAPRRFARILISHSLIVLAIVPFTEAFLRFRGVWPTSCKNFTYSVLHLPPVVGEVFRMREGRGFPPDQRHTTACTRQGPSRARAPKRLLLPPNAVRFSRSVTHSTRSDASWSR